MNTALSEWTTMAEIQRTLIPKGIALVCFTTF